ncbi:predicted protein [Nematostella vectensis]|uniref:Uncharacterized protein n=1 Tax=Nematostella vectensis TaxID=45351 RepID=A7SRB9_NEMVE|nr:predicted protein [Nematostella vectensis]|eukprot:XP_001625853.1 predicted protein [Nematostella vectensis]
MAQLKTRLDEARDRKETAETETGTAKRRAEKAEERASALYRHIQMTEMQFEKTIARLEEAQHKLKAAATVKQDNREKIRVLAQKGECENECADELEDKIMGNQAHCHIISDKYAARVSNLYTYDAISKDILHRWAYPIVPDNSSFFMDDCYSYSRHNLYLDKNLSLASIPDAHQGFASGGVRDARAAEADAQFRHEAARRKYQVLQHKKARIDNRIAHAQNAETALSKRVSEINSKMDNLSKRCEADKDEELSKRICWLKQRCNEVDMRWEAAKRKAQRLIQDRAVMQSEIQTIKEKHAEAEEGLHKIMSELGEI